jgi:hypothetical protein
MCGRATYKLTWEEIVALYRLTLGQPAVNTRALQRMPNRDHRHDTRPGRQAPARADALGANSVVVVEAAKGNEARHVQRAG